MEKSLLSDINLLAVIEDENDKLRLDNKLLKHDNETLRLECQFLKKELQVQQKINLSQTSMVFSVIQTNQKNYKELLRGVRMSQKQLNQALEFEREKSLVMEGVNSGTSATQIKLEPIKDTEEDQECEHRQFPGYRRYPKRKVAPTNLAERSLVVKLRRN